MTAKPMGSAFVVGAGPGDPRLITVRGAEIVEAAEILLYDPGAHAELVERATSATEKIVASTDPRANAQQMVASARAGRKVVRLVVGDPFLFGTGDVEVAELTAAGVSVEVVPGVPPELALGAYAGIPLTRTTDASPTVALAAAVHDVDGVVVHDWEKLASATDTLVMRVPAPSVWEITRSLLFYGRSPSTPCALVQDVGGAGQRVWTGRLDQVGAHAASLGAVRVHFVIGEAVSKRASLAWLEKRPLFGKRVLVTRASEQARSASASLRARGAEPVIFPTIVVRPPEDAGPLAAAVSDLGRYDWIAFTSANGVDALAAELSRQGKDARAFGQAKVAVIGPGTAQALAKIGVRADLVAAEHRGEGLASAMLERMAHDHSAGDIPGRRRGRARVLIARAKVARDVLPQTLRSAGCEVDVVTAYETHPPGPEAARALEGLFSSGRIDAVLFTSSSTVENLCALLGGSQQTSRALAATCVASIGPITTATATRLGLRVDVTAESYTLEGLLDALEAHVATRPPPSSGATP